LLKVIQEKDLGVTFDERLTFEHHILEKVKKANQTMALDLSVTWTYKVLDGYLRLWSVYTLNMRNRSGLRSGRRAV